jgi:plasmid maintenance system antidote protein VapI
LARYFGTSEQFSLNLKARHDLEAEKDRLGDRSQREVKIMSGAVEGGGEPRATA